MNNNILIRLGGYAGWCVPCFHIVWTYQSSWLSLYKCKTSLYSQSPRLLLFEEKAHTSRDSDQKYKNKIRIFIGKISSVDVKFLSIYLNSHVFVMLVKFVAGRINGIFDVVETGTRKIPSLNLIQSYLREWDENIWKLTWNSLDSAPKPPMIIFLTQ